MEYRVKPSNGCRRRASVDSVEPPSEAGEVAVNHREAARWYIGPIVRSP
jgi:hypothetical protein